MLKAPRIHCMLAMLGRYQFLSLIYFVHFGKWPTTPGMPPTHPSPTWEGEWANSWNDFYRGKKKVHFTAGSVVVMHMPCSPSNIPETAGTTSFVSPLYRFCVWLRRCLPPILLTYAGEMLSE